MKRHRLARACVALFVGCWLVGDGAPARSAPQGKIIYVAATGDDHHIGSESEPLLTLQRAADLATAGATIFVRAGQYAPFTIRTVGRPDAPVRFVADANTSINAVGESVDAITVDGGAWIEVEGFAATSAGGAGLRLRSCSAVTVRRNQFVDNNVWGIVADNCSDVLLDNNEVRGSVRSHGVYLSNGGDHAIVRGNRVTGNTSAAIAVGGDNKSGQDGIITGTVIEDNMLISNGVDGSPAILLDGAVTSLVRNNVVWKSGGAGITLQHKYGGSASTGTLVEHNTIVLALGATVAVELQDAAVDTIVRNNILVAGIWPIGSRTADELLPEAKGAMAVSLDSLVGLRSDYNIMTPRFFIDGEPVALTLPQWQQRTRQDKHSISPLLERLFRDAANGQFELVAGSAAIDRGEDPNAVHRDLAGNARPVGLHVDAGAYEFCTSQTCHQIDRLPDAPRVGPVAIVTPGPATVMVPRGCCGGGGPEAVVAPSALVLVGWPRRRRKR